MAVDRCAAGKVVQLAAAGGWGSLPRWGWGCAESRGLRGMGCRCGPGALERLGYKVIIEPPRHEQDEATATGSMAS
jgi:hypothetical protein